MPQIRSVPNALPQEISSAVFDFLTATRGGLRGLRENHPNLQMSIETRLSLEESTVTLTIYTGSSHVTVERGILQRDWT